MLGGCCPPLSATDCIDSKTNKKPFLITKNILLRKGKEDPSTKQINKS